MGERILAILAEEKKTLSELRDVAVEVSRLVEFDEEVLARALGRRSDLMLNLSRMEEVRAAWFQGGGSLKGGEALSDEIRGLAHELSEVEVRATANLGKILLDLKKQASSLEKSITLVQGYGLITDHLSRFADRKG